MVRTIREILSSWYSGFIHLCWGKDRTEQFVQVRRSEKIQLIDGAWQGTAPAKSGEDK